MRYLREVKKKCFVYCGPERCTCQTVRKMSSPEERAKRRNRFHNRVAKDLRTPKYKPRVKEDRKRIEVKDLTHADLVRLIQETEDE